jgi:hypothetical protein
LHACFKPPTDRNKAYNKFLICDGINCWLTGPEGIVFKGIDRGDVVDFRGINYAEKPTGSYRWKAPVLKFYEDDDEIDGSQWGNMCACHRCFGLQARDCNNHFKIREKKIKTHRKALKLFKL